MPTRPLQSNAASILPDATSICSPVIVTRKRTSEVLLIREGTELSVPRVALPRWERQAPHLIAHARKHWHLETIGLFNQPIPLEPAGAESRSYVLEARPNHEVLPETAGWVSVEDIDGAHLSTTDSGILKAAISQAKAYDCGQVAGGFGRSGWFDELSRWIESQISPLGLLLSGGWSQYSVSAYSCLMSYETNGSTLWFKATDAREYAITIKLAELCRSYVPAVIAMCPEEHGWLALHADGKTLDDVRDLDGWKNAARSLAALQLETVTHVGALIEAGCADRRLPELTNSIDTFLHVIANLMKLQPSCPPAILGIEELQIIERKLKLACRHLHALGFPDAVGNGDLNAGNIVVSVDKTLFLDWMHANVSNPLIPIEHLLALLRRLRPDCDSWESPVRDAYAMPWTKVVSRKALASAFQLTPLVAAFAFAISCPGWRDGEGEVSPHSAKLLRAMARRMYLEAQRIKI